MIKRPTYIYPMLLGLAVLCACAAVASPPRNSGGYCGDELVFIRVTENLPLYASYAVWGSPDGETLPVEVYGSIESYWEDAWEKDIWIHPPGANYLAYIPVKLFPDYLRWISWITIAFSLSLVLFVCYRKLKGYYLLLCLLPLFLGVEIWLNGNIFYHDIFLCLCLTVAIFLRGTKYEKFIYIPLALMVITKIYAIVFLIPFVIENRKTALCSLALIPYFIQSYFVTGSVFYPLDHWLGMNSYMALGGGVIYRYWFNILKVPWFLLSILPFIVYGFYRKLWFYPALFLIGCLVIFTWGFHYQMLPLYIISPLVIVNSLRGGKNA